ncbi:hypothetical protein TNCV_3586751 [Trichonephila clavipes]|nr:hypothetical protein TNCV_3586751 [Trichonephila clavipes]
MIPAYNQKSCAAFSFETGIHFRRKTDFLPEEDTTKSYSGFEPEPTRLQAEGHSHHTGRATVQVVSELIQTSHCSATRGLLATDHVTLNQGQMTWTTPDMTPLSPNYHTTATGGHFSSRQF